jgi:amino acid permease
MSCAHYRQISFQGLVRAALGQHLEFAVSLTLIVLCFGTCAGYLNVIGNYASAVVHQWSTVPDTAPECLFPSQWWCAREFLMPAFGTAVVLPLCESANLQLLLRVVSLLSERLLVGTQR